MVVGVQELDDVLVLQLVQDLNFDHEVGQLLLRLKAQVDFFQYRYSVYLQLGATKTSKFSKFLITKIKPIHLQTSYTPTCLYQS